MPHFELQTVSKYKDTASSLLATASHGSGIGCNNTFCITACFAWLKFYVPAWRLKADADTLGFIALAKHGVR